jgi:hypothetical protein
MDLILEQPQIFSSKAVWHVDIFNLNDFIAEKYNLSNFEGNLEASNDTSHEMTIDGELDQFHGDDIEKILKNGNVEIWGLSTVLNDMCNKGWILPGNYIVRVSW